LLNCGLLLCTYVLEHTWLLFHGCIQPSTHLQPLQPVRGPAPWWERQWQRHWAPQVALSQHLLLLLQQRRLPLDQAAVA
jgi:hypothetical protein